MTSIVFYINLKESIPLTPQLSQSDRRDESPSLFEAENQCFFWPRYKAQTVSANAMQNKQQCGGDAKIPT